MNKMIEITCINNGTKKLYQLGTTLEEIYKDQEIKLDYSALGALVNNEIEEMSYAIFKPKIIRFIDITHTDGMRMYVRSLSFVLQTAVKELYPEASLKIEHSVSKGYYCELSNGEKINEQMVSDIRNKMREIINKNLPFERDEILVEDAIKIFEKNNFTEKIRLFELCPEFYTSVYSLAENTDYFYGYLVPSTGYLSVFDIVKYYDGLLLRVPKRSEPTQLEEIVKQDKLFEIFREHKHWAKILEVPGIGGLNEMIVKKRGGDLIKISEALHEKKVARIADKIHQQEQPVQVVLISGPSSSGKTTFCKRLSVQLQVAGMKPISISLDNYFVDREDTPKDENGEFDFEALGALDVELFNKDLLALLEGKEIEMPKFSFAEGKRFYDGETLKLPENGILLIEGIHGLNPELTPKIPNEKKYKIYVSALTQLGIDRHNRIPTTDNRLLRRIVRDFRYRNYSAYDTLKRWGSVRRGEDRNIFPYQEEADVMFNSALLYELSVLKRYAEPLLKTVPANQPEYAEALRLLKFLSYFQPIADEEIPPTSILREFLTGSTFDYS